METSMCQQDKLTCPRCDKRFKITIWLIVDTINRPNLVEQIRAGTLHDFACPKCHRGVTLDVPLLLYRPGKTPTLIFSPADSTTDEEDRGQLAGLVGLLRKQLGRTWQDSWLTENAYIVSRKSLPLSIDSENGQDAETRRESLPDGQVELSPGVPADLQEAAQRAALATRYYKDQGDETVLELAIATWQQLLNNTALKLQTASFQWRAFNDAGNAFMYRHRITRDMDDLDQAISLWEKAADQASDVEIQFVIYHNLGGAFDIRHRHTRNNQDLEHAIRYHRNAVRQAPADSPLLPECLKNLGNDLLDLYKRIGRSHDLEESVTCFQRAIQYTSPDSSDLADYLKNLANSLSSLFDLKENPEYLDQAIQYHRQACNLLPLDSTDRPLYLSNLAAALGQRYNLTTNLQDLDGAIDLFQEAVDYTPLDSPDFPDYLVNLGIALINRYQHLGRFQDLERAIGRLREAVAHSEIDSPDFPASLYELGVSLYELFAYTREEKDLEEAISILQQAIAKASDEPRLPTYLSALSGAILERYRAKGQIVYLEEAIAMQRDALERASSGIPALQRILQYNLGMTLMIRYERLKESSDVREAISLFQETVQSFPPNSLDRPRIYISLGDALRSRYNSTKEREDLDSAIQALRTAIHLLPSNTVELRRAYHDLGNALRDLYAITKQLKYLDEAIQLFAKSLDGPDGIANRCIHLCNFGRALQDYYVRTGEAQYLHRAKGCYEQACKEGEQIVPSVIMQEARSWGHWAADRGDWKEATQAYTYALQAFELLYKEQLLQTDKEIWAGEIGGLYDRAAYVMARAGLLREAILTLEKGRAKTLSEALARDYTDLEHLKQEYPEAYERYRLAVGHVRLLEREERRGALLNFEKRRELAEGPTRTAEHINKARVDLGAAIAHIRGISGYENFLKEPTFEDISKAAVSNTPLVYIAVTPRGSLTLLLYAGSTTPELILEEHFNQDHLVDLLAERGWQERLQNEEAEFTFPKGFLPSQALPSPALMHSALSATLSETLPLLGSYLVGPIVDRLLASGNTQVMLIPTGGLGLLPLHAATYESEGKQTCLLDIFAVAYAPSARALTIARQEARERQIFPFYFVGVGNPSLSHEQKHGPSSNLPFARTEVETIVGLLPPQTGTALYEDEATLEAVWRRLPEATTAHFSCHGIFDPLTPLDAALVLAQGTSLTLRELLNAPPEDLARLRLIVLSACQTALTDFRRVPDESIGLLSGFLQAGIPSVVGTLWPVMELSTALLMVRFYELFLQGDPDARLPPQVPVHALRLSQCWLRDLTYGDLQAYTTHLPDWNLSFLEHEFEAERNKYPYADPFYWAAFAYYGVI